MKNTFTTIEAFHYIITKLGTSVDRLKLIKLIYLADKYHLINYGHTITHDTYFAMPLGVVGYAAKDVLSFDDFSLSEEEYEYASTLLKKTGENNFDINEKSAEYDMLSETDISALDFVINHFGKMNQWELRDYTHKYPEWSKYKNDFDRGLISRKRVSIKELSSVLKDDPLSIPCTFTHKGL